MQTRALTVPRGKDLLVVRVSNHTYVLLKDATGSVRSRWQSTGKHLTFALEPGRYTLETDGRLRKVLPERLEPHLRAPKPQHLHRPPKLTSRKR